MRNYSELEKSILISISQVTVFDSNILKLLVNHALKDGGLAIDHQAKELRILIQSTETKIHKIQEIFQAIFLIKFLEENYFISLHSNYEEHAPIGMSWFSADEKLIENMQKTLGGGYSKLDVPTNLFDEVNRLSKSFVLPTTQLKDLVKNGFKSYDQVRHELELSTAEEQHKIQLATADAQHKLQLSTAASQHKEELRISKRSFGVALAALVLSLLLGLISPLVFETTLDEKQFNYLVKTLEQESISTLNQSQFEILLKSLDKSALNKLDQNQLDSLIQAIEGISENNLDKNQVKK